MRPLLSVVVRRETDNSPDNSRCWCCKCGDRQSLHEEAVGLAIRCHGHASKVDPGLALQILLLAEMGKLVRSGGRSFAASCMHRPASSSVARGNLAGFSLSQVGHSTAAQIDWRRTSMLCGPCRLHRNRRVVRKGAMNPTIGGTWAAVPPLGVASAGRALERVERRRGLGASRRGLGASRRRVSQQRPISSSAARRDPRG